MPKGRKGERWHAPNTKTAILNRETGHWLSVKDELLMRSTACLSSLSNSGKAGWETDGEQRGRWSTFGALKELRRRIRASLVPIWLDLTVARASASVWPCLINRRARKKWSSKKCDVTNTCPGERLQKANYYNFYYYLFLLLLSFIITKTQT